MPVATVVRTAEDNNAYGPAAKETKRIQLKLIAVHISTRNKANDYLLANSLEESNLRAINICDAA